MADVAGPAWIPTPATRRRDWAVAWAAAAYLMLAGWVLRPVLPAPASLLPTAQEPSLLAKLDGSLVLSVVTRNADTLLRAPQELLEYGQCFPLRRSHTLGEHMFGAGVLAAVPYLLTGEPILSYNVVLLLKLWIAGLSMFLLARDLLGRPGPAFVAGLAYQLAPAHLFDLIHPYLSGDAFTPLAAFFLRRLMVAGGARNAVGLALASAMTMLESFYALVASWIVLGTYGCYLAWRHRAALAQRLPLLAGVLAWLAVVVWVVFMPYVEMSRSMDVLKGRLIQLPPLGRVPTAHVLSILAIVALVDRARRARRRDGDDPRLALLLAALLSLWFGTTLPPVLGVSVPSAPQLLAGIVPGFDAVRAPHLMGQGLWFVLPLLAGFAVLALTDRLRPGARALVAAGAACAIFAERAVPALSRVAFGRSFEPAAWHARPEAADIELVRATRGPIVDLPIARPGDLRAPGYLRLTSFSSRPTAACANSFASPLATEVVALAAQLPAPAAADALYALGFRTVLLHLDKLSPSAIEHFERKLAAPESRERILELGRTERLVALRLRSKAPTRSDLRLLGAARAPVRTVAAPQRISPGKRGELRFTIRNRGIDTFLHPEPLLPTAVVVRWLQDDAEVARQRLRLVLPLALARGASARLRPKLEVPVEPGRYQVVLALAADESRVLAFEVVDVAVEADGALVGAPTS